jgi:ATP-dependent Clp protease ATP-binding subunit ClpB
LGKNDASVDAANFLKPMLARGEFHCVGATTFDEFRLIERDPALTRRFLVVKVDEPGCEESLAILQGLRHRYERFHGVRIQNEALVAAVELSDRYMGERRQPDKSIDLIDESCAYLRSAMELPPEQVRAAESLLNQLRLQEASLRREGGDELMRVRSEIRRLEKERAAALCSWETTRAHHLRLGELLKERDLLYYAEGGRSYTGELKQPKTGLLQAALAANRRELSIVPMAVAYDLVLEDRILPREALRNVVRADLPR